MDPSSTFVRFLIVWREPVKTATCWGTRRGPGCARQRGCLTLRLSLKCAEIHCARHRTLPTLGCEKNMHSEKWKLTYFPSPRRDVMKSKITTLGRSGLCCLMSWAGVLGPQLPAPRLGTLHGLSVPQLTRPKSS